MIVIRGPRNPLQVQLQNLIFLDPGTTNLITVVYTGWIFLAF